MKEIIVNLDFYKKTTKYDIIAYKQDKYIRYYIIK